MGRTQPNGTYTERRILEMILVIFDTLCEVMSLNIEELTENILDNDTAAKKWVLILNALQEYDKADRDK